MKKAESYPIVLDINRKKQLGMVFSSYELSTFMVNRAFHHLQSINPNYFYKSLKILEPSCGTGALILTLLSYVRKCYKKNSIPNLSIQIDGFEIEKELIDLAKQNVVKQLAGFAPILRQVIDINWYPMDFLQIPNDKEIYDVIIANPPYVAEKDNKALFRNIKQSYFGQKYYEKGMNLYYYFIEKSIELLAEDGILCFVTPAYWTRADLAKKLRQTIRSSTYFVEVFSFGENKLFSKAPGHHSMVFLLQKKKKTRFSYYQLNKKRRAPCKISLFNDLQEFTQKKTEKANKTFATDIEELQCDNSITLHQTPFFLFIDQSHQRFLNRLSEKSDQTLADFCQINQGLVTGADKLTKKHQSKLPVEFLQRKDQMKVGRGIFILSQKEKSEIVLTYPVLERIIFPLIKNSDIKSYHMKKISDWYILYTNGQTISEKELFAIQSYLYPFKPILEERREVVQGKIPFYSLHWPRKQSMFQNPSIICPQRTRIPCFSFSKGGFYASADVYFIHNFQSDPLYLLAYLNSKIVRNYLAISGKRKGKAYELYQKPLAGIPILRMHSQEEQEIIFFSKQILNSNNDSDYDIYQSKIDALFQENLNRYSDEKI